MQSTNEFWSRKQFSDCQTSAASQWLLVRDNIGKNVTKTCGHYNAITPPQVTSTATSAECRQATFTQRLKTAASSLWSPSPPTPAPIHPGLCLLPQPVHLQPCSRSTPDTSTTSTREQTTSILTESDPADRPPRDSDIPNCSCFYLFSVRAQPRMETFYNTKLCKLHKKSVERSQKPYQLILRSQTFLYFSNFEIKIIFLRMDFLIWGVCETHPRHCLILIFGKLRNTFSSSGGARGLSNCLTESKYINRVSLTRLKILVWLLAKSIVGDKH